MRYLLYLMIISTFFGCKKDDIDTYNGPEGISFWKFYYETLDVDPLPFTFAYAVTPQAKDTVYLRMRVTGKVVDYPRTVLLKAVEGTTARAGVDYLLTEAVLPANAHEFEYPVIVLNSPEMLTKTFRLVLELAENKDFKVGATGLVPGSVQHSALAYNETNFKQFKIDINNILVQPAYWNDNYFGIFSAVKFKFMVQHTGLTDFSEESIGVDGMYNLPVKLQNVLEAYEAANGPLFDENGERVTFLF